MSELLAAEAVAFGQLFPVPSKFAPPLVPGGSGLPAFKNGVDDWHLCCASACWRLAWYLGWETEPSGDVSSAAIVAARSGTLNGDASAAPMGAWHFWTDHVGTDVDGGGTRVFEGYRSPAVFIGSALGFDSVTEVSRKLKASSGMEYLGWSTNYAGGIVDYSRFIPATHKETDTMLRLVYGSFVPAQPAARPANGAGYYLVNGETGKYIQVIGTQDRCNMLGAFIASPGTFQGAATQADFDWLIATLGKLAELTPAAKLTDTQLGKIGEAVHVDLSGILETLTAGFKALPGAVLDRLRTFWSTGK